MGGRGAGGSVGMREGEGEGVEGGREENVVEEGVSVCVDAVRGVSAIRIETVRVALLRHHPHTLSGAGRTRSDCVTACVCV